MAISYSPSAKLGIQFLGEDLIDKMALFSYRVSLNTSEIPLNSPDYKGSDEADPRIDISNNGFTFAPPYSGNKYFVHKAYTTGSIYAVDGVTEDYTNLTNIIAYETIDPDCARRFVDSSSGTSVYPLLNVARKGTCPRLPPNDKSSLELKNSDKDDSDNIYRYDCRVTFPGYNDEVESEFDYWVNGPTGSCLDLKQNVAYIECRKSTYSDNSEKWTLYVIDASWHEFVPEEDFDYENGAHRAEVLDSDGDSVLIIEGVGAGGNGGNIKPFLTKPRGGDGGGSGAYFAVIFRVDKFPWNTHCLRLVRGTDGTAGLQVFDRSTLTASNVIAAFKGKDGGKTYKSDAKEGTVVLYEPFFEYKFKLLVWSDGLAGGTGAAAPLPGSQGYTFEGFGSAKVNFFSSEGPVEGGLGGRGDNTLSGGGGAASVVGIGGNAATNAAPGRGGGGAGQSIGSYPLPAQNGGPNSLRVYFEHQV